MLFAGTCALGQDDIKRVLAYSTISQLGYMFMAAGMRAYGAAIFMLAAHAFYKALMFLGAGSVMHGMHEETDMREMGGLIRRMPLTGWTFTIGALSLAGVPFLAGFYAKDEILQIANSSGRPWVYVLGSVGALLSALYIGRLIFLTFFGSPRSEAAEHAHESPPVMTLPLVLLAVGAAGAGVLNSSPEGRLATFLEPVVGHLTAGTSGLPRVCWSPSRSPSRCSAVSWRGSCTRRARSTGLRCACACARSSASSPTAGTSTTTTRRSSSRPGRRSRRSRAYVLRRPVHRRHRERDRRGVPARWRGVGRSIQTGFVRTYAARVPRRRRRRLVYVGFRSDGWLTIVTFLPLVGVPILLAAAGAARRRRAVDRAVRRVATFVVSLGCSGRFERPTPGSRWWSRPRGSRRSGCSYLVGVDGVSLWMVLLTTFLFPSRSWRRGSRHGTSACTWLDAGARDGVLGSFVALDLLLFFVFFEAILVPMLPAVGGWGGERRVYAAVKFFLYTMAGSAFLLVSIIFLVLALGRGPGRKRTPSISASSERWARAIPWRRPVALPRVLHRVRREGAGVPAFHTWLPDAHTEAPPAGLGAAGRLAVEGGDLRA
jgi:NADH:ubiquinone oxidoreductase subunit 4 (subunit M)